MRGRRAAARRVSAASVFGVLATCLLVFGLVTAVRAIRPAQRPTLGAVPAGAQTVQPPGQARARPPRPAAQITLAFAGDVHFEGRVRERLDTDPATVFGPVAAVLTRADLAMVNLETAITERGTPEPKQFTFRAPPTA